MLRLAALMLTFTLYIAPAHAITRASGIIACFVPGDDCAQLAIEEIDSARRSLRIMAYGFTHSEIVAATVRARKRGVAVSVVLDKTSPCNQGSGAETIRKAGITTVVDRNSRIQHNKVIIVDDDTVLTGSFNFTMNAAKHNAENFVIIDNREIARGYREYFLKRWAESVPYKRRADWCKK